MRATDRLALVVGMDDSMVRARPDENTRMRKGRRKNPAKRTRPHENHVSPLALLSWVRGDSSVEPVARAHAPHFAASHFRGDHGDHGDHGVTSGGLGSIFRGTHWGYGQDLPVMAMARGR